MNTLAIRAHFVDDRTAGRLRIVTDMPALQGSEKQIAWASEIRAAKQIEFGQQIAKYAGVVWGPVVAGDADYIAESEAKIASFLANPKYAQAIERLKVIFSVADARFWIDNRTDSMDIMATSAAAYLKSA